MNPIEKNRSYVDNYNNVIIITDIGNGCIYYNSTTKKEGLINRKGLYFLENSEYHKNLKQRYFYSQINEYNHSITDEKEKLIYYIFFDKVTSDKNISQMFNKLLLSDLEQLNKDIDYYLSYSYFVENIT